MNERKISVLQAILLFALAVGITNHVLIVPLILHAAKRDAWVSALLAIPAILLWTVALYFVMKKTKQAHLFDWLKSRYGSFVSILVMIPFLLMLVFVLFITVRDTTGWTKVTYLQRTPYVVTVGLYVVTSLIAALAGLRTIAVSAGVLIPAVIVFGYFVMSANYQFKDYSYLFPLFTKGTMPVLAGSVYTLAGMVEMVLLLCIQQHLKTKVKPWGLIVAVLMITGLVFGPLTAAIAIFGPFEAADQRYPAFEQWRMVMIGKFISHLDFLSIYQWLSGSLIRISFAMYLLFDLLKIKSVKQRAIWMPVFSLFMIAFISRYPLNDKAFIALLRDYYFPIELAVFYCLPFVLLLLVSVKRKEAQA